MAVEIIIAVLTGAILVMFIEYQHLEKEVTERFFSIMKPFYYRLTLFAQFVTHYRYVLTYKDINADYIPRFRKDIEHISRCGGHAIICGGDIPVLKADEIEKLCECINDIWYVYDKGQFVTEQIGFDFDYYTFAKKQIEDSLRQYDSNYIEIMEEKYLLPKVAGDFYVNEWQPVQNTTREYEYWQSKCSFNHKWALGAIIYLLSTLFFVLCFPEYKTSIFMGLLAAVSLWLLGFEIYLLRNIVDLCKKLFR